MNWTVVIPVKRLAEAKSRLRPDIADVAELALAFATDTIVAARNSVLVGEVIVVTPDPRVVERATALGAWIVPDPGTGLNAAAAAGIRAARTRSIAVLTGDLPALETADLDGALQLADLFELAMVADHSGTGTTLIASSNGALLEPRFGPRSRDRHEAAGHTVLPIPVGSALRWDVDTVTDLATALTLGIGEATASVVSSRAEHPA